MCFSSVPGFVTIVGQNLNHLETCSCAEGNEANRRQVHMNKLLILALLAETALAADIADCPDAPSATAERLSGVFLELAVSEAPAADRLPSPGAIDYEAYVSGQGPLSVKRRKGGSIQGFIISNTGSPRVLPYPAKNGSNPYREWAFEFPDRARQGLKIHLTERSDPQADVSANEMNTALYLFPRRVVPSVVILNKQLVVTLPTGEKVQFDQEHKEITGGVLHETAPVDNSTDRFKRKFPQLSYTGQGVMVRADQRGETPESDNVWGAAKWATITHGKKSCKVRASQLWNQSESETAYFLYPRDEDFYSEVLVKKCGWNSADLPR